MWMMPLHLHVNQKSDYDDDDVNWVFMQPDYSQLRTCKINCVFLFFYPTFFVVINNVRHVFLIECSHQEFACIYLFTHTVCLSRASN